MYQNAVSSGWINNKTSRHFSLWQLYVMYNYDSIISSEYTKEILVKNLTFLLASCIMNIVKMEKTMIEKSDN